MRFTFLQKLPGFGDAAVGELLHFPQHQLMKFPVHGDLVVGDKNHFVLELRLGILQARRGIKLNVVPVSSESGVHQPL